MLRYQTPRRLLLPGVPVADMLEQLDDIERIGAHAEKYGGGEFLTHPDRIEVHGGDDASTIMSVPDGRVRRWLLKRALRHGKGPFPWHYQVNFPNSCAAGTAFSRKNAIEICRTWIDKTSLLEQTSKLERRY